MPSVSYDNNAFYFFAATMLFLFAVPSSIYIFRTIRSFKPGVKLPEELSYTPRSEEEKKKVELLKRRIHAPELWTFSFRVCTYATIIAAILFVVCLIVAARTPSLAVYDPYLILEISAGASEREIRTSYRRLSLSHHPDKGGDADKFQKIAKAYEALSNPEARENWEKYGNPDGKQAMELAMGLPSILVHPQFRYVFLISYILILCVLLPYIFTRYFKASGSAVVVEKLESELKGAKGREEREAMRLELVVIGREARVAKGGRGGAVGPRGISGNSVAWINNHLDVLLDKDRVILQVLSGVLEAHPGGPEPGGPVGVGGGAAGKAAGGGSSSVGVWDAGETAELKDLNNTLDPPGGATKGAPMMQKLLTFNAAMPPMTPTQIDANFILHHARLNRLPVNSEELRAHQASLALHWPDITAIAVGFALVKIHQVAQILSVPPSQRPPALKKQWVGASGIATVEALCHVCACVVQALPEKALVDGIPTPFRQVFTPPQFWALARAAALVPATSGASGASRSLLHFLRLPVALRAPLLSAAAAEGDASAAATGEAARLSAVVKDLPVLEGSVHIFIKGGLPCGWSEETTPAAGGKGKGGGGGLIKYTNPSAPPSHASLSSLEEVAAWQVGEDMRRGYSVINQGDWVTLRVLVRHVNAYVGCGREGELEASRGVDEVVRVVCKGGEGGEGPPLPVPFTPHFPIQTGEEWHVWAEEAGTRKLLFPVFVKEVPFQTWTPTHALECMDINIGGDLPIGKNTLKIHFQSSLYLGLNPEPFSVTILVNAKLVEDDGEEAKVEEEEELGEEDGILLAAGQNMESIFFSGEGALRDDSDVSEDEGEKEDAPAKKKKALGNGGGGKKGEVVKGEVVDGEDEDDDFKLPPPPPPKAKGGKAGGASSSSSTSSSSSSSSSSSATEDNSSNSGSSSKGAEGSSTAAAAASAVAAAAATVAGAAASTAATPGGEGGGEEECNEDGEDINPPLVGGDGVRQRKGGAVSATSPTAAPTAATVVEEEEGDDWLSEKDKPSALGGSKKKGGRRGGRI